MEKHMLDYRTLLEAGACGRKLALFRDLFPGEAEVSVGSCVAVADRFDWDWAARGLLPAAAQDEYKRARAAARRSYRLAMDEYNRAIQAGRADASARAAGLAYAAAQAEYHRVKAAAWAQAWLSRHSRAERLAAAARKRAAVAELVAILAERRTETRTHTAWVYGPERGCASWTVTLPAGVLGADASDLAPDLRAQWDAWEGEFAAANRAAYAEAMAWAEAAAWTTAAASANP